MTLVSDVGLMDNLGESGWDRVGETVFADHDLERARAVVVDEFGHLPGTDVDATSA